ncbi:MULTISPECIES: hypothetical protein [Leptospira]|uniref:hypothetical protein n=1 Tax=Leptospira TaxID=171 RepID=UPI0002BD43FC|nr:MULTISPECIES: hypothetical protein [Leptospira]EMJ59543.1 hypothetical protein LEP1GSC051_4376 [Leptospira sp. P2653]UPY77970.1 hypothetical protein FH581_003625 [Leptospira weilii]
METEFTYDELRELSYLVWNKKTKLREQADGYTRSKAICDDAIFKKLAERTEGEFELFKNLESKLEKMKHSVLI